MVTDDRSSLRTWWRDDPDYRWPIRALAAHDVLRPLKLAIGIGGLASAAVAASAALSWGPDGAISRPLEWVVAVLGVLWWLRWWLLPWPSAIESLTLFAIADIGTTAAGLGSPDMVGRAIAVLVLMVTGLYATFFHSPRVLAAHIVWLSVSVAVLSVPMFAEGYAAVAAALILVTVTISAVVLPGVQYGYWVLRTETLCDPLTSLLSRRGLEDRCRSLLDCGSCLPTCVMVVDLDRFKRINDRFGHRTGDEVLMSVAERLRAAAPADAVVARIGGEEFAVLSRLSESSACAVAENLRSAIARSTASIPVTASIGVAVCAAPDLRQHRARPFVNTLLDRADAAMYQAKQRGGNTVVIEA
ncbi:GGDEF domain-containing protein [Nocardia terpenica]|uniref:GGDEF domain-containing protein n=1 Tax=Nocardia terpenica TaxID=455432 RepID=A0A291RMK8_9NOCA|nr:GGDEF domain-containing protein [Nocardia terpenica]